MEDIKVLTDFPLAADSGDHLMPHGTRMRSSIDPIFRQKLYSLYPDKILRVLDLGCAGGEFVRELINDGNIAVGLEGSDWSRNMQREAWPIISKFLFTCDITKPFAIRERERERRMAADEI